jgi:hypothetical protein
MKALALLAVLSAYTLSDPAITEPPQAGDTGIKWNLDYLEKTWGLKAKSITIPPAPAKSTANLETFKLVLEFTKDIDDLKTLKAALEPNPSKGQPITLYFYYFDEENVSLGKTYVRSVEGEITGKKGDAIRVYVDVINAPQLAKTKKIEARPVDMPSPDKK